MTTFRRHVAVGDPQAPFHTFLAILRHHHLLNPDGRLADDVQLVSMGDHFDWGTVATRAQAAQDGLELLRWLASHDARQVIILLGNHDLGRVGELAHFDDDTFARAQADADAEYHGARGDAALLAAFSERHPDVPTTELLARDYATFRAEQRTLVTDLLRNGRLRLAHEHAGLLLVHAGVTTLDLQRVNTPVTTAAAAARGLNAFLAARVASWMGGTLDLSPFHFHGNAERGEGGGALYHRPGDPSHKRDLFEGEGRRRFDPRDLPDAFPQAIGHIRDGKCRELMPAWSDGATALDGPLRSMRVAGGRPEYAAGCAEDARMYFLDNGMAHAAVEQYQLFDLDRRRPLPR